MIKAYKLYTGEDGHSHVTEGQIISDIITKTTQLSFKESALYASYDWHTAPSTQYVITLSGILEFTTFLGETFIIKPGEVLVAMDTTGSGHKWKLLNDEPWKRAYVVFDKSADINFVEN